MAGELEEIFFWSGPLLRPSKAWKYHISMKVVYDSKPCVSAKDCRIITVNS